MGLKTVVFDDFSGGDEGRERPIKDVPTTFRAVNVWQYPAGIGPRPPFQALGITGLPTGKVATFNVLRNEAGNRNLVWAMDSKAVYWSLVGFAAAASLAGSLTNKPIKGVNAGNYIDWVSPDGYGGHIAISGTDFGDKTAMPVGRDLVFHGEHQAVAGVGAYAGKLKWSETHDTTLWPSANEFFVGFGQTLQALFAQRNALLICTLAGDLWMVTGVLGVNESLRKIDTGIPHPSPGTANGAVANQSKLWYCAGREMVTFTGASLGLVPRPDLPQVDDFLWKPWYVNPGHVVPLPDEDEIMVVGTLDGDADATQKTIWAQAYRPDHGLWTRHHIPVTPFTNDADSSLSAEAVRVHQEYTHDGVYISTSNSAGAPKAYTFNPRQEYPHIPVGTVGGVTSNTLNDADSGAPTVASFATGEVWHPEAKTLAVTSVLVDYSYDPTHTPLATYSHFDLSVEALQNPGSAAVRRSAVQSFTPAGSGSTPDGSPLVRGQARFQVGDQGAGQGFRVRLDDWRGILVHRISVQVDESPARF